jgi:phosphoribosylaminoimidazole carboxylase PurK protein
MKSVCIGILGDGQLSLMLREAAEAQGIDFKVFADADVESVLRNSGETQQKKSTLMDQFSSCSVITLENEFHTSKQLNDLSQWIGVPVVPSPEHYQNFEGKIAQRKFYQQLGIPSPKYWIIETSEALEQWSKTEKHYPVIVKASVGGYDGYGVRVATQESEVTKAFQDFKKIVIEEKINLLAEFAQGAIFDGKGRYLPLPLVETVQVNGICEYVLSEPRMGRSSADFKKIEQSIQNALRKIAESKIEGLFNFEFFATQDANQEIKILINEGAPRPHNSQHLTLDAVDDSIQKPASQFSLWMKYLQTRSLENLTDHLFDPKQSDSAITLKPAVMINLLGQANTDDYRLTLPTVPNTVTAYPKLYGKKQCRIGRKMGHLNLVANSMTMKSEELLSIAERIRKGYQLA